MFKVAKKKQIPQYDFSTKKWKKKSTGAAGFVAPAGADPAILQMAAGFVAPAGRHILKRGHGKAGRKTHGRQRRPMHFCI